jgi:UDP-2-acetamido-3-amino-2,3-dideoxy-glucuronate N-acetyltransferase
MPSRPKLLDDPGQTGAALRACGARLLRLPRIDSAAGTLVWAEHDVHLPFVPRRFFCIYEVPPGELRGRHAHRRLEEVLVCLRGRCVVTLDDGDHRDEVLLDDPRCGLYIPPLTWSTQRFSGDALLAVLASEVYRPDDYIRDYETFLALRLAACR